MNNQSEFDPYSTNYKTLVNDSLAFSGLNVDFFTKVKAEYLKDILLQTYNTTKVDTLDLGCGVGNFHPLLVPHVRSLSGTDVSGESIKIASANNPDVRYKLFAGKVLPFPSQSFDLVFAVCVFHHVPLGMRANLVAEAKRVLRTKGTFVIFEHNPINPLTMRVVSNCVFDKDAILLKSTEAQDLLKASSFAEIRSRHILTVPAFNKAARIVDQLFGRVPLGAQYFTMGRN